MRRIQKWSKILCQTNQEFLKTSKNNYNSWKRSSANVHVVARIFWGRWYYLFYLGFCVSSDQQKNTGWQRFCKKFERHFYMKIIATIIPTNLVANSLLPFFVRLKEPKTRIKVSASWWCGNENYFCFLFISARALLQRYAEFNKLL